MIVPMKKVTLFVSARHKEESLKALQKLGVLHIKHVNPPMAADITDVEGRISQAEKCTAILSGLAPVEQQSKAVELTADQVIAETLELSAKNIGLESEKAELLITQNWFETWGAASKADLEALQEKGIFIRLYSADQKFMKNLPEDGLIVKLFEDKSRIGIALVSEDENQKLDLKEEYLPEISFPEVQDKLAAVETELVKNSARLVELQSGLGSVTVYQEVLQKDLAFAQAKFGMGEAEETISYLQGYCPVAKTEKIAADADKNGWGYVFEDPADGDNPPTQLENKKWIQLIQPVLDFLGTVPGYREYDISKYFLIFLTIYFAMIIGDAGYGVIFMVLALFMTLKTKKAGDPLPLIIKLLYVVSTATIIWGAITGNWFGAEAIARMSWSKAITIPQISAFPDVFPDLDINPNDKVMYICFVLALIQLGLANIMNFINALPGLKALSHLGWLSLTVGLFMLVLNLVLTIDMPAIAVPLIGSGLAFIILFSNQEKGKSIVKGMVQGLGGAFNTFLDAISSFSNIISYIRLFAVGMASVAIASSFNDIAAPMLSSFALPAGLIILLIGHGLNVAMGLLSVIVHGIRLNMLEFSGQLGMEWIGYKYLPFSNKKNNETN